MSRAVLFAFLCVVLLSSSAKGLTADARGAERVTQAGDVVLVLNEEFLNSVLDAITSQSEPPTFPLNRGGGGAQSNAKCQSQIALLREAKGGRTAVRFADGLVHARVAFRGSYNAPLIGCLRFEGWADAVLNLEFDPARQTFNARIVVREVSLKNVPSIMSGGVNGLVQDAINERVNPLEILRAEQLGARIPIARNNELRLRARELRHEVVGKELRLRIVYEIVQAE
jgi:hypothetical protein